MPPKCNSPKAMSQKDREKISLEEFFNYFQLFPHSQMQGLLNKRQDLALKCCQPRIHGCGGEKINNMFLASKTEKSFTKNPSNSCRNSLCRPVTDEKRQPAVKYFEVKATLGRGNNKNNNRKKSILHCTCRHRVKP